MKRRVFAVILLSLTLFFAFAACAPTEDDYTPGGKVGLSFWHPLTGPDGSIMRNLISQFNQEYEGRIEVFDYPNAETQHYSILMDLVPLNKGPDIAIVHSLRVPEFVENELLDPIEDVINSTDVDIKPEDYIENAISPLYIDGKLYAIPLDVHMIVVYYNKELLGSRPLPTNREEFIATAKAVQQENSNVWGLPLSIVWPSEWLFTTALYQNGGKEIDQEGYPAFNTEAGELAMKAVADFIHVEGLSPTNVALDEDLNMFKQGKALFHIQGTWMLEGIKESGIDFGIMPVSYLFNLKETSTNGQIAARSHTFVKPIKSGNDYKNEAIATFIKWLGDHSDVWASAGQVPAKNSARETDLYKSLPYHQFFGAPENFRLSPPSPYITSGYNPVFEQVTVALSTPNYNAKQLLNKAEEEAIKLVNALKG